MGDGEKQTGTTRRGGKVDRRVVKTRAAIRSAFRKLVKEHGLSKVTVSSLAREADIDRKTFYLHYDSIGDLVDDEAEQMVGRVMSRVDQERIGSEPRRQIRAALDEVNAMIRADLEFYTYIAGNLSIDFILDHIGRAITKWFDEHGDSALLANVEMLAYQLRFYLVGAVSVYGAWLQSDRMTPLEKVSDMLENALDLGLEAAFAGARPACSAAVASPA